MLYGLTAVNANGNYKNLQSDFFYELKWYSHSYVKE